MSDASTEAAMGWGPPPRGAPPPPHHWAEKYATAQPIMASISVKRPRQAPTRMDKPRPRAKASRSCW